MRRGVTIHIGGTFGAQEQPPPHYHHLAPAATGWKSPVPYLFGGLAAMLGLIAFALLILACSYWKLSGYLDGGEDSGEVTGDEKPKDKNGTVPYPNSILVIMAGEENPTFLAMPSSASCSCSSGGGGEEKVAETAAEDSTTTTTPEEEKNRETTT